MAPKHRHRRPARRGLAFESLESRLLLSADLAPGAEALAAELSLVPAEHRALDAIEPAPQISMRVAAHEIVFVDGALADREPLIADFVRATGADRPVEVVVLDPSRDGVAQIGEALAARTGLTAVHILSHGRDGALELGATTLDAAALEARGDEIAAWGRAIAADGDLLLYGCDVADTVRGEAFLGELARLTGTDVAASDDPTGDAARGGDWALEYASGAIEFDTSLLDGAIGWAGLLADETLDWEGGAAVSQPGGAGTPYTTGAVSLGGGTVTVTVSGYTHDGTSGSVDDTVLGMLTSGSPVIDQSETGGLPGQSTLRLVSTGFEPDDPGDPSDGWQGFLITIDFSHAGGVSNVGFSIFDIDTGGFVDEIVATSNQGAATGTTGGANNTVIAPGIVRGTASSGAGEAFGNATFSFAQSGITRIQIFYKNAGGQSTQGIALHDVSFHVNDPPAIAGLDTLSYTENDPATVIAGLATVTDADSSDFATGALTVSFTANGTAADQLAIRNEGTLAGQIGVSGANVTFGGVTIGTFAGGANGTNLVVTFNAGATPAAAQALVRNITFANTSEDPSTLARTVRLTVTDGDGGSAFADATVNVARANDAPVLAGSNDLAGIAEDPAANAGTAVSALVAGQITDVDSGALRGIAVTAADGADGLWEYSLDGGTSWNPFGTPGVGTALLLRDTDRVRFVPTADWNGTATMSFRAWDRTSGVPGGTADTAANGGTAAFSTAVATSSVTVSAVADAVNDGVSANEDTPAVVNVFANDSFENPGATLTGVTAAANGTVSFTAAGAVTYTPNADWHGSEVLTYTVTSGGVAETAALTVTILPIADAVNDAVTVDEDNAANVNVLANDDFEDLGRTLTAVSAGANGAVGFTAAGAVAYTPNAHWSGTEVLTYTVTAGGLTETGTLTITVTPVADAPALTVSAASGNEDTAIALSVASALVDTDGSESLALTVSTIPVGAVLSDGTSSFTATAGNTTAAITGWNLAQLRITPPLHSDADFTLTVTATSTEAANLATATTSANLAVAVNAVADAPTLTVNAAAGNEDTAIALTVNPALVDTDGSETLALSISSIPIGATLTDGTSSFTASLGDTTADITGWTLAALTVTPPLHGDADFTLTVSAASTEAVGGSTASTSASLAVTVNAVADAPTLIVAAASGNEDTAIGLTVNPALVDTDGSETLTLAVSSIPIGATLSDGASSFTASFGNTTTAITGWNLAQLRITPPLHTDADFTLTVSATATETVGGSTATTSAGLAVTVDPVADAPTLAVAAASGDEDTAIGLTVNPALVDTDGSETLTLTVSSIPIGATLTDGALSFTASLGSTSTAITGWNLAQLRITPPLHSDADFTLSVTAASTEAANLAAATTSANLAVTVNAVADAPTLTVAAASGDEDTAIGLTVNPALVDTDGSETLWLSVASIPIGATLSDGALSFTASPGNTTTAITGWNLAQLCITPPLHSDVDFTLTVSATATEAVGGSTATTSASLAVTVDAVADTPTLTVSAAAGNEDTAISLTVTPALVDTDGSESLALSISSIPVGAVLADGTSSFTATAGNTTADITGWNLAALTVTPPLHSDADFTLSVTAASTEAANLATATTSANLAVTVNAVADAPTLTVTAASGNEDTAISLTVTPALVDTDGSETLTLSVSSIPIGATLSDGALSFTASLGNTAAAITGWNLAQLRITPPLHSDVDFTLTVSAAATETIGGSTATTSANLAVTVNAVADAPTLAVAAASGNEDTAIPLTVNPALVDTDGSETLTLSVSSIPIGATLTDGTSSFTAAPGNTTADITGWTLAALTVTPPLHSDIDFTLTVSATSTEAVGGPTATTSANLAVTVDAVADTPTLALSAAAGDEDTAIALNVASALVDTDGSETLSLSVAAIPIAAVLTDGTSSFTATAGNTTADITGWSLAQLRIVPPLHSDADFTLTVSATASEGLGGSTATASANLAVTVDAVADAPALTVSAAAGNEDTAIALTVNPALVDTDGSETLALAVSAIPIGATLSDGVSSFTASPGNTATAITGWNLAQLRVTPPLHSDTDFTLTVSATATEAVGGSTATTGANLAVTVDAVADAPTLAVNAAAGNEDTAIGLTVNAALVDTDGSESLTLTVSAIPIGATLTDGTNSFTATAGNTTADITGWTLAALTVTPAANADTDFTLTVTATSTEAANLATASSVAGLLVDVQPVNDAPTVATPAVIDVVEDVASPLPGISFADVDAYAGLVTATFTVADGTLSATAGGGVAVGGTATALTLTGSLANLNAFLAGSGLRYTTVLNGNAPVALTASLNDLGNTGAGGPLASPNANVTLNVIPVNDAPVLGGVTLDIDAGGRVVLTAANMSATDVDDPLPGLVFVIANLENGRFELAGNSGVAVLSFTQAQVLAGQVTFVHTDALRPPSYLVFVTDGASTVGPGIVALTFRPLVEPGGTGKGTRDDGGLPSVSFASAKVDTSLAGLADPFAIRFNRQPVVPHDGGDAAVAEAEAVATAPGTRQAIAAPGSLFEVRPRGFAYPDLGFQMDKLPTAIQPLEFGLGPQRPHEEPRGLDLAIDAIRTMGMVMSVGAVWWAMRAAGLVSSLLAITPAWRHIDPLPVLGRDENDAAGGWEEPAGEEAAREEASASEMFDGAAKRPPSGAA